jgi:hypothetical protein
MPATDDFLGRHTLLVGDVNTGKTQATLTQVERWIAAGYARRMTVLDLAPEIRQGIGGRLALPLGFNGLHLHTAIVPPRLAGADENESEEMARRNAQAITPLLAEARRAANPILVINDVTLYLQAGDYDRLLETLQSASTVLINAYYGDRFPDYALTRRERRLTERLMTACDQVMRLP